MMPPKKPEPQTVRWTDNKGSAHAMECPNATVARKLVKDIKARGGQVSK